MIGFTPRLLWPTGIFVVIRHHEAICIESWLSACDHGLLIYFGY